MLQYFGKKNLYFIVKQIKFCYIILILYQLNIFLIGVGFDGVYYSESLFCLMKVKFGIIDIYNFYVVIARGEYSENDKRYMFYMYFV